MRASEAPPVNALIGTGTLATPKSNAPFNHRIPPLSLSPKEAIENSFHGGGEQVVLLMSQILMGEKKRFPTKLHSQKSTAAVHHGSIILYIGIIGVMSGVAIAVTDVGIQKSDWPRNILLLPF